TPTNTCASSYTWTAPASRPLISLDVPSSSARPLALGPFQVAGWALDQGAVIGSGVDYVHVWALPNAGGSPVFLGAATYGLSRTDVGASLGGQCTNSGYSLTTAGLPQGSYRLTAYAHSSVTGSFMQQSTDIVVKASDLAMAIDVP